MWFRFICFGSIVLSALLPALAVDNQLVNGSFEDGYNGWQTTYNYGTSANFHNPPVRECVCGDISGHPQIPYEHPKIRAADGEYFGGGTWIHNSSTTVPKKYSLIRQQIAVRNWYAGADRVNYHFEIWVQLAHSASEGNWSSGYVGQEWFLYWRADGQQINMKAGSLEGLGAQMHRIGKLDSSPFMNRAANPYTPNFNNWRKIVLDGSIPGNPQYVVLELSLSYSENPPTCHNLFDGVVLTAESATGSSIGPFMGDIPNSGFEEGWADPNDWSHSYADPDPPLGWLYFADFEHYDDTGPRGPIEGYSNGVTVPTNPRGVTTPYGNNFWGRVRVAGVGSPETAGWWGHVVPVRKWTPSATGFRWRLNYATKIAAAYQDAEQWFEICWDVRGSGYSVTDVPPDPYQAWMLRSNWFGFFRLAQLNWWSLNGATAVSGFTEIEQSGEFAATAENGEPVCPPYVLLRNRTGLYDGSADGQMLYDKIDFYVEAIGGCNTPAADMDGDGDVDQADFAAMQACMTGAGGGVSGACICADLDADDQDVDSVDLLRFENCASGPGVPADPDCEL